MSTLLEQAVAQIKAGDTEKAKQLLAEMIKQNPRDEDAWLWMTRCVVTEKEKRYCFERVLKINPQNKHAIEGIRRLNNPASPDPLPTPSINPPQSPPQSPPQKAQPRPQANRQPIKQPVKKKRLGTFGLITVIGLGFAFIVFCLCPLGSSIILGDNTAAPTEDRGGSTMAYIMCQQFIEDRLVSPATAEFPPKSEISVLPIRNKKESYQAKGYVDSQNRMSALIRTYYVCEVSYVGNDRWNLDYLDLGE